MKNILTLSVYLLLIASSCQEETEPQNNEPPTCGCGGPTEFTVPSDIYPNVPFEVQTSGVIFFKDKDIFERYVPDDRWEQKFWIFQITDGCISCRRNFIICNDQFLNTEFDFLKAENNSDSVPIIFKGNIMIPCAEDAFIGRSDDFYREIELTFIEKAN